MLRDEYGPFRSQFFWLAGYGAVWLLFCSVRGGRGLSRESLLPTCQGYEGLAVVRLLGLFLGHEPVV